MEGKNKREPIYIFQCGCEIPESKVERKRMSGLNRTLCGKEEHYSSAWLIKRKGWCIFCGSEFDFKNSGKMPETCQEHRRTNNKLRKPRKRKTVIVKKHHPRAVHCKGFVFCSASGDPKCSGCSGYDPIFQNVDPEKFRKLLYGT